MKRIRLPPIASTTRTGARGAAAAAGAPAPASRASFHQAQPTPAAAAAAQADLVTSHWQGSQLPPLQRSSYDDDDHGHHHHDGGDGRHRRRHTKEDDGLLSEHEYQVRVGRAVQLLRATLPDFLNVGLADYPPNPPTARAVPLLDPLALVRLAPSFRRRSSLWRANAYDIEDAGAFGSIYHPDILFEFMPSLTGASTGEDSPSAIEQAAAVSAASASSAPASPPSTSSTKQTGSTAGEPSHVDVSTHVSQDELDGKPSFSFSGRTLYLASAHVLRHALKALFTEAHVSLDRLHLLRAGSGTSTHPQQTGGSPSPAPLPGEAPSPPYEQEPDRCPSSTSTLGAQDELIARLTFSGVTRVMHQPHEYTVLFRYTLDRATGQIVRHRVERIQPEVGRSLWTGLSSAWFRLAPHMYPGSVVHCVPAEVVTLPSSSTSPTSVGATQQARTARTATRSSQHEGW